MFLTRADDSINDDAATLDMGGMCGSNLETVRSGDQDAFLRVVYKVPKDQSIGKLPPIIS